MPGLLQDVRIAARFLAAHPGFTTAVAVLLAVGVGVNTAVFSTTYAIAIKQLPFPESERLVELRASRTAPVRIDSKFLSIPLTVDLATQVKSLGPIGRYMTATFTLTGGSEPQQLAGLYVTPEWFVALRTPPTLGRTLTTADLEAGHEQVVVLSHALWRTLGSNPAIVGQQITLAGQPASMLMPFAPRGKPYTVVGVMPESRIFPAAGALWVPLRTEMFAVTMGDPRRPRHIGVLSRLTPGVSVERANAELSNLASHLGRQYAASDEGWDLRAVPIRDAVSEGYRPFLVLLLVAVNLVLALACVCISGLLVARNRQRQREMAIRAVLGATRARLVQQALCESLLLSLTGGAAGILLATWFLSLVRALAPGSLPRLEDLALDRWVLAYTTTVAVLAGLIIGLAPALHLTPPQLATSLKDPQGVGWAHRTGTGRPFQVRGLLIALQIAFVFPLAVGSLLMLRSLNNLGNINLGYAREGVVSAAVKFSATTCARFDGCNAAVDDVLTRVRALPGVQTAAVSGARPLSMTLTVPVTFDKAWDPQTSAALPAQYQIVTPEYFRTLSIPVRSGRSFLDTDTGTASMVAMVNETLARQALGDQPLGRKLSLAPAGRKVWFEVVGVVADSREAAMNKAPAPTFYVPFAQANLIARTVILARTAGDPRMIGPLIASAVHAVDPLAPVTDVQTIEQIIGEQLAGPRFQTLLLTGFAGLGLLLVVFGVYGLISYASSDRMREFGIRMALGAQSADIRKLVMAESISTLAWGLTFGAAAAVALARALRSELFEVGPADPLTFISVFVVIVVAALLGYFLPARRATRIAPWLVIRNDQ